MADFTDDIFFATTGELVAKLRAREFSTVELTRALAERLEKLGPRYNALALPLRDRAIDLAKDVDDQIKRERFRGPLQGVPYGAKDLLCAAGKPTTLGRPAVRLAGFRLRRDADPEAAERGRAAGGEARDGGSWRVGADTATRRRRCSGRG